MLKKTACSFFLGFGLAAVVGAQTAEQAWLGYGGETSHILFPRQIRILGGSPLEQSAADELKRSLRAVIPAIDFEHNTNAGLSARVVESLAGQTIVGTVKEIHASFPSIPVPADLAPEGYWIAATGSGENTRVVIAGSDDRGVLYGVFAFLRGDTTALYQHPLRSHPAMPIRWVDEWDNIDGSIERG
jgi:alpha-glucuronidase